MRKFFGQLFLINFTVGVVTGIVQEFQFGMNWNSYSRFVGHVFGAPLAMEGLLAFFMESVFIGLWIFGWNRLSPRLHLATIWLAAIGTNVSAFFILAAGFLAVRQVRHGKPGTDLTAAVAAVALLAAAATVRAREGWAFAFTAVAIAAAVATLFGDLWPNVLPSSTAVADSLTVTNASSAHYTLMVMTWVALIFTPVVLAYQGWTYWVFRKRLSSSDIGPVEAIPTAAPPPRFAAGQP